MTVIKHFANIDRISVATSVNQYIQVQPFFPRELFSDIDPVVFNHLVKPEHRTADSRSSVRICGDDSFDAPSCNMVTAPACYNQNPFETSPVSVTYLGDFQEVGVVKRVLSDFFIDFDYFFEEYKHTLVGTFLNHIVQDNVLIHCECGFTGKALIKKGFTVNDNMHYSDCYEAMYDFFTFGYSLSGNFSPVCPCCGNEDFHINSTEKLTAATLYDNEDSYVLSLISFSHNLFESAGSNSFFADLDSKEENTHYVMKKTHYRLTTNKKTKRTYWVRPGTSAKPIDVSYKLQPALSEFLMENVNPINSSGIFKAYLELMLSNLHSSAASKLIEPLLNGNISNSISLALTLFRMPQLTLLGDELFSIGRLDADTKKRLFKATNRKEAFKAIFPAIGKKAMKSNKIFDYNLSFVASMFENPDHLQSLLGMFPEREGLSMPFDSANFSRIETIIGVHNDVPFISSRKFKKLILSYFPGASNLDGLLLKFIKNARYRNDNMFYFIDICRMHERLENAIIHAENDEQRDSFISLKEAMDYSGIDSLHDALSIACRNIQEVKFTFKYTDSDLNTFNRTCGPITYRLAESNHELNLVGGQMHICVGSYSNLVTQGNCMIVLGFEEGNSEAVLCIEVKGNSINQVKEKYNNLVKDSVRIQSVLDYMSECSLNSTCYDTSHYHDFLLGNVKNHDIPNYEQDMFLPI